MRKIVFTLALIGMTAAPVLAQEATPEAEPPMMPPAVELENVVIDGLNSPRGIAFDEAGNLYIAEGGSGGDKVVAEFDGMQATAGLTSQVTVLAADGTVSVAVPNLISGAAGPEALGAYRAVPVGGSLWLVISEQQGMTVLSDAVIEIDLATGRIKNFIDQFAYEAANNPDGTEEIYSNPSDVEQGPDGRMWIVNTGMNTLLTWAPDEGLQTHHAWTDDPVPTSVDFGSDGSIYIGFLGTGIAPGMGHVERWSAEGELLFTYEGLTAVTDILVTEDDTLYAVQLISEFGEQGPVFNSGSIVQLTEDAVTPIAEGLPQPFGLAQNAEGNLLVSVNTAFAAPGSGAVVEIVLGE